MGYCKHYEGQKCLTFYINGCVCAIEASNIIKIVKIENIVTMPHSQPHMLGIIKIPDGIYSVIDMRILLGGTSTSKPNEAILICSKTEKACIVVDRIISMVDIENIQSVPALDVPKCVMGITQSEGMCLLSAEGILANN